MPDPITTIIQEDASKPELGTVDGVTIRKRSLTELIAADKYVKSSGPGVITNPAACLSRVKIIQPGTV